MSWDLLTQLFSQQLSLWWIIWPGILLGIVVGFLPGFNAENTLIMLLPLTLAMPVQHAFAFMTSLYCATHLGGGIPAILVRIPGTPGAAATTLDGYPLTLALLPWLSVIGLYLRSVEMVVVMLFGLTLIALIAAKDVLKGLIAGLFGLMIGMIGVDHIYNTPRATFGFLELYDGVPLAPALIGLFAVGEALTMVERKLIVSADARKTGSSHDWGQTLEAMRYSIKRWWHVFWTGGIGLLIGIVPGAGASIASFVAYQQSRMWSKHPERYGTGEPDGVIAAEGGNNGVCSGTLVPMMALGVPGGSTSAVMMIVLQYHGMVMGPQLFSDQPQLAYGVFVGMLLSYLFMILTIFPLARYMSRVVLIETTYLVPIIILVTVTAAFSERQYL